jgi:hypothetical protein
MSTKTKQRSKTQISVENGIKILRNAIRRKISLSEASRRASFGRNYVYTVKSRLSDNYKNRAITKETYQEFKTLVKEYNSINS